MTNVSEFHSARTVDRRTSTKRLNMYGTTLRVWDPNLQAWRITSINPSEDHDEQQIGCCVDRDVVQIGTSPDGTTTRRSS
jgi:hypothetical protein